MFSSNIRSAARARARPRYCLLSVSMELAAEQSSLSRRSLPKLESPPPLCLIYLAIG